MKHWYGPVQVLKTENNVTEDLLPLEEGAVKSVHYPDCQQLIIWLPAPGRDYGMLRLLDETTGQLVETGPVDEKLSGSIQLIWDTLSIPPGSYRIEICRSEEVVHRIHIRKLEENQSVPVTVTPEPEPAPTGPVQYRDGFGNPIVEEDLRLREKATRDIVNRFTRKVTFTSEGRSGAVIYIEGDTRITFYYELGGAGCIAWIDIPAVAAWEQATGLSIDRRDEIIAFVAQQAHDRQAPGSVIQISETSIALMKQ